MGSSQRSSCFLPRPGDRKQARGARRQALGTVCQRRAHQRRTSSSSARQLQAFVRMTLRRFVTSPISVAKSPTRLRARASHVVEHPKPITVGVLRSKLPKVVGSGSEFLDNQHAAFLPLRIEMIDFRWGGHVQPDKDGIAILSLFRSPSSKEYSRVVSRNTR